jgi:hypothetical protein
MHLDVAEALKINILLKVAQGCSRVVSDGLEIYCWRGGFAHHAMPLALR